MAKTKINVAVSEFFESFGKTVENRVAESESLKNVYVVEGYNLYGFSDGEGYAVTPPLFRKYMNLGDGLVLVESNYNFNKIDGCEIQEYKCGIFDTNENKMFAGCIYDHVDVIKAGVDNEYIAFVDLYIGANSYTLDLTAEKKELKLNTHLSERTLKVLERKPELFMKLDSAYFVDEKGNWNKTNVDKCLDSVNSGMCRILSGMSQGKTPARDINKFRTSFNSSLSEKLDTEKSKIETNKTVKL